jgi:hypothetical protein
MNKMQTKRRVDAPNIPVIFPEKPPKRIDSIVFLTSLGVVSTLIIQVFDSNAMYGVTDPMYIGLLGNIFYSIAYNSLFFSVVVTVFTLTLNFMWETPLRVLVPAMSTLAGLIFYIPKQVIYLHYSFIHTTLLYNHTFDTSMGVNPSEDKWAYYLAEAIPLWIMFVVTMCLFVFDVRLHFIEEPVSTVSREEIQVIRQRPRPNQPNRVSLAKEVLYTSRNG